MDPVVVVRLLNAGLVLWTAVAMIIVTWRLSPEMTWYQLLGRFGITVVFATLAVISVVNASIHAPYGPQLFALTFGLGLSTIGFTAWAVRLIKRPRKGRRK